MFRSKLILLLVLALLTMVVVAGCGQEAPEPKPVEDEIALEGTITVVGSTSVEPLAGELAKAFMAEHPEVRINVGGGGSSKGIKAAFDGTADIGMSSRELKEEEAAKVHEPTIICRDGIAVVVHPENEVDNLTKEQVRKIYAGEITNWKEVDGRDAAIAVITREEGSGTRGAFEKIVMDDAKIVGGALVQKGTGAVRATVAGNPDGIGYVSIGALNDTVKALDIDGIAATVDNVRAGEFPIARPFLFVTKEEPAGLVKEFINFCLGPEGQAIVAEDFVPL